LATKAARASWSALLACSMAAHQINNISQSNTTNNNNKHKTQN
jgi:hypothetical protein